MRGRGGSATRQMGSWRCGEAPGGVSLLRRGSKGRLGGGPRAQRWLDGKELSVWFGERARGVRAGYMGCGACARGIRRAVGDGTGADSRCGETGVVRRVRAK